MDINKTQIPREVESDSDSESEERYHNVVTGLQSTSLNNENQTESQSDNEKEDEPVLRIEKDISKALAAKESGNEKFRNKLYDESIQMYSYAITYCPEDEENKDNLAAFYGNRSAAYFAMEEYQLTVNDCSDSIKLKPEYVKVLMRRSQAQEKLGHLEEALADAKEVARIEPTYPKIQSIINRLEKENEEKMTKLKDEALGKLKDLGNSILGNFGMSLDNFKMTQDPTSGGWNISMQK